MGAVVKFDEMPEFLGYLGQFLKPQARFAREEAVRPVREPRQVGALRRGSLPAAGLARQLGPAPI